MSNLAHDPRVRSARARLAGLTASSRATPEQVDDARQELAVLVAEPQLRELAGSLTYSRRLSLASILLGHQLR